MAVTIGVMLHVDRAPATVVAPLIQPPVIEAAVIAPVQSVVTATESSARSQFRNTYSSPNSKQVLTYDLHGTSQKSSDLSGSNLDVFA
ncbi:MAG: hypothetical protein ABUK11_07695 [Mariprofundaceae bacterium]